MPVIILLIDLADDYMQFISQNQRDEIQRKFDALRDSCSVSKAALLLFFTSSLNVWSVLLKF